MSITILFILIFLAVLIIYAIIAGRQKEAVITSQHENSTSYASPITADMVYYLPSASLVINASAKVTVIKDASETINSAHLTELVIEPTTSIIPDTDFLCSITYNSNIFANDELRLTAGTTGLLETVLTTTDDQLSNIIKQIADAPAQILSFKPAVLDATPPATLYTTSTLTFTKVFHLNPNDIVKNGASCPWIINMDGTAAKETNADASFKISFVSPTNVVTSRAALPSSETIGLFTRPLTTFKFKIIPADKLANGSTEQEFQIIIPDPARIINIPVKRSAFVKRINTPKFSNGLLLENYINIPSQVEGFISIPINIAKTIVSIPAALFNFTIHRKYDNQLVDLDLQKKLIDARNILAASSAPKGDKKAGN